MGGATILWFRRDLRLSDHAALTAATKADGPVIPIIIRDALVDGLGTAPAWRLGVGLAHLDKNLRSLGSRLILRSGNAQTVLDDVIRETGAKRVFWSRAYDPDSVARDTAIKTALKERGIDARSFGGHVMHEPWSVETKTGGMYKVFTPYWRAVSGRDVEAPLPKPGSIAAPDVWPSSENLEDWELGRGMKRGKAIVAAHAQVGEDAAQDRLAEFMEHSVSAYGDRRDLPAVVGTSTLSENLSLGEISPHQCWHAGQRVEQSGQGKAGSFLRQLVWRDFAYHLMHHTPHMLTDNWKPQWDSFPWNTDPDDPRVISWTRGRTGIRFVDAAMREMYVTGRMHNRGRMIVASYLTKHLLTHWRIGLKWFEDCLIDWDPACNAMGWQWAAGSGPDAAPYFRVFNPVSQREKFDPQRLYVDRWIAEGRAEPNADALRYFDAIPKSWSMTPEDSYPDPIVSAEDGRKRALSAYEAREF